MKAVYLKLFRTELMRHEKRGGFLVVEKLLRSLESFFTDDVFRLVLLLEGARISFLRGRWEECLDLLDQVDPELSVLGPDDRALYFILCARLHQGYGDLNQALTFLEIALQEAEEGEGDRFAEAMLEMGGLFHRVGEQERGNDFLRQAEARLRARPNRRLVSQLAFEKGMIAIRDEQLMEAERYFKISLSTLGEKNPSVSRGEGVRFLGILAAHDGRPIDALKLQREALNCFLALPYPRGVAKAYNSLGQTCLQLGRFEEARFFLEKAVAICREIGAEADLATVLGKLGSVYARNGEYEKAISFQEQDLELSSRIGNFRAHAFSLRNLGLSHKAKGDLPKAVSYLRDSRDRFAELEDHAFQVKADLDLVSALLEHDRLAEAFGFLEDAQNLLERRMEVTPDHVHARYFAGLVALKSGNLHLAENCLWQALEMCNSFSLQSRQADVHYCLARLYVLKNDSGAAQEELSQAYRLARAYSRGELVRDILKMLHDIEPDAVFHELMNPRF